MNKKEAQEQLKKVEKEMEFLRNIINKPESLFDTIKTYEDVCKALGEKELNLSDFSFMPYNRRKKALAQAKIQQLEELFNQGVKLDWSNKSQYKYYPYYEIDSSGCLRFYCSYYGYCGFHGAAGFYKDEETSNFIGKTFIGIYQNLM